MSTAASSLRFAARRCQQCRVVSQAPIRAPSIRQFTSSIARYEAETPRKPISEESPQELIDNFYKTILSDPAVQKEQEQIIQQMTPRNSPLRSFRTETIPTNPKPKAGFFNLGEKKGTMEEDPEYEEDDISAIAHGQLEQHREFREYARIAAWEMPLLTKMAKPFEPPTGKQVLRFRYTTYMGEEHPAEKKVVVEFCPADMPDLTPIQREKLKKLAGVRYNPETEIVKMSCEMFESQAQNKRYLGDLVDTMLREARDPTDTFEDVPLDLRHHTFKTKHKMPKEWRMTPERMAELEKLRQESLLVDEQRALEGTLVDGVALIQEAFQKAAVNAKAAAIAEPAGAGKAKGKTGKLSVRR